LPAAAPGQGSKFTPAAVIAAGSPSALGERSSNLLQELQEKDEQGAGKGKNQHKPVLPNTTTKKTKKNKKKNNQA